MTDVSDDRRMRFTGDAFTGEYLITAERYAPPATLSAPATVPWALLALGLVDSAAQMTAVLRVPVRAAALGVGDAGVGLLMGSFALAQVIAALACGWASDRVGRRAILVGGLGVVAAAHLLFLAADGFAALAAARVLHGLGSGTAGVALAAMVDGVPHRGHARLLGWFGAAASLGAAVGPALFLTLRVPELAIVAIMLGAIVPLRRTLAAARPPARDLLPNVVEPRRPWPYWVMALYAVTVGSASRVSAMLPLVVGGPAYHGAAAIVLLGLAGAVLRATAVAPVAARLGERWMLVVGLLAIGTALALLGTADGRVGRAAGLLTLALGTALAVPALNALVAHAVPASRRGAALGVQQAAGGVARALFPVALGVASAAGVRAQPLVLMGGVLGALAVSVAIGAARRSVDERRAAGRYRFAWSSNARRASAIR